ncbi:MAG TPA: transketolase family protein [Sulfolobales archaeon]|nr:transketolase family protein [Sulfolobales archaeon]
MLRELSSMRETFGKLLVSLGEIHRDLVVITADVGDSTRASYFRDRFPARFFNVGISEQHMVNFAAGLAAAGMRPLVTCFAMFLMRAWEQIRNTTARMNLDVKFIATHAGLSDSIDGSSHQALEDIALMRVIPNMKVVVPADSSEIMRSLPKIVAEERGPVYYRIGRDYSPPITADISDDFKLGRATVLRDGEDITIIGAGPVLWNALEASKELSRLGIKAAVIDMATIKPIDEDIVESYARKTGAIVTVEEHSIYGGLGSAVAEVVVKRYPVPMKILGTTTFGRTAKSQEELIEHFGLGKNSIIKAVAEVMGSGRRSRISQG